MLRVENLSRGFGRFKLDDISIHIPKGYICGLIGQNGAGKSTFIKLLLGIYNKETGKIIVDGMDFDENEAKIKNMLGIVMDENFFDDNMTPIENAKMYGPLYSEYDEKSFLYYLEKFNIAKDKKLKKLSKGTSVKFQLAFALSHNAKLFLFDEPTAGFDTDFRKEFIDICTELIADGERTIIFSTHLTEDLDRVADYIAFIDNGKLLFLTTKEDLCNRFVHVQAENYKLKLIPKKAVVHMEEGVYGGNALIVNSKMFKLDEAYEKRQPTIEEIMYYFIKGGSKHAKDIVDTYMEAII